MVAGQGSVTKQGKKSSPTTPLSWNLIPKKYLWDQTGWGWIFPTVRNSTSSLLHQEFLWVESHMTASPFRFVHENQVLKHGVQYISAGYKQHHKNSHLWPCQYKNHRANIEASSNAKVGYRFTAQLKLITLLLISLELYLWVTKPDSLIKALTFLIYGKMDQNLASSHSVYQ